MSLKINDIKQFYWQLIRKIRMKSDPFPHWKYADKHKCIFIHIPKAAGTSIITAIGAYKRLHIDYSIYEQSNPGKFKKYFKFCLVRNPWDRCVSTYFYFKDGGAGSEDRFFRDLFNSEFNTFEKFVLNYLDSDKVHEHVLFKPQYLYVYNIEGQCQVDFVGRLENIEKDFQYVSEKLNLNTKLPKLNASKRNTFEIYYTEETWKKVSELYKKDIKLFGYETDKLPIDN